MLVRLTALLGVLLALSGCSAAHRAETGFPDGTSVHTMAFGGLDRSYRVHKPAGLAAAAPLVVMLHGAFGDGEQAESDYGWDPLADSAKFVVAYPDGVGRHGMGTAAVARPSRREHRRRRLYHHDGRADQRRPADRQVARLCHRDQQRRHHELRAGLQQRHLRGHRSGLGHPCSTPAPHRTRRR